ncbi:glycoside hydrolase domain-containing protein [Helcococcus kunzii]|uniref:glycoside hydrolase domain-containing protein n=1 Tax=Helcococcus kunzii TaxID=40091 RepID=UPI0024ADFA1F|nr:glycoside hydrolase domain-containing protein [Helcococcus kunzii]
MDIKDSKDIKDPMVLKTQEWLNDNYGNDVRFTKVDLTGKTGWPTIHGLILAFQIELGIQLTAPNFGNSTITMFNGTFPEGIKQQNEKDTKKSNIYTIIQGALWCKGYSTNSPLSQNFYEGTGQAIRQLKSDMGLGGDSTVTIDIMEALLSMKQYVLLRSYGGTIAIREIQQKLNREYPQYIGIIPTDGLYGREMNTALIKVLQAELGFSPDEATGNFGDGTKSRLITLNVNNYNAHINLFRVAYYTLRSLGYGVGPFDNSWTNEFYNALYKFQEDYGLKVTDSINLDTWMSLLTSKGNTERKVTACDTRYEITNELISEIKADGYEIVGRYLTGGDYKEIRDGELRRIVDAGMKYFPIFQENAREIKDFSYKIGLKDGRSAVISAKNKGIPKTVIYFAVDMDILDYQIDSNILPYFKGVTESVDGLYDVGVYGSRNVCSRVSNQGYAISSFVSDMSTGFSGNLGFKIPNNWNYDQIFEISKYKGRWDLDKVAYSGRIPAVSFVHLTDEENSKYSPKNPDLNDLEYNINEIISLIVELEKIYYNYGNGLQKTYLDVLNYLSKSYITKFKFAISASNVIDVDFINYFRENFNNLYNKLESVIGDERVDVKDTINGKNDIAHLAFTTLCYLTDSIIPDYLTGWGGDISTGASNIQQYSTKYPNINKEKLAHSLIGADISIKSVFFEENNIIYKDIECNFTDLCDDADAIGISSLISSRNKDKHVLSNCMKDYYMNLSEYKRFSEYGKDLEDMRTPGTIYRSIKNKFNGIVETTALDYLRLFVRNATDEDRDLAYKALAEYIYRRINVEEQEKKVGWVKNGENWNYYTKDGSQVISKWQWTPILDEKGQSTNKFNWKYFDSKGNNIVQIYTENGSSWLSQVGPTQQYYRGWWTNPDSGSKYYFRLTSGTMVTGRQYIDEY